MLLINCLRRSIWFLNFNLFGRLLSFLTRWSLCFCVTFSFLSFSFDAIRLVWIALKTLPPSSFSVVFPYGSNVHLWFLSWCLTKSAVLSTEQVVLCLFLCISAWWNYSCMMHILQIHLLISEGAAPSSRNAGCFRLPPNKDFPTSNLLVYGHITLESHSCLYYILMQHQMCNDKETICLFIYCSR